MKESQRGIAALITLGLNPQSVGVFNLKAGSVAVSGDKAAVVLVGTLCSTGNQRSLASISDKNTVCRTNLDRDSVDPGFIVRLSKSASGTWEVVFQRPKGRA